MGLRADLHPRADALTRTLLAVTLFVAVMLAGWLLPTATAAGPGHIRTVTIVNQTGLTLAVDAVDAGGSTQFLGMAQARATTRRYEVADIGQVWAFAAAYGGQEVYRTPAMGREQLAAQGWTVRLPPGPAITALEDAGFS